MWCGGLATVWSWSIRRAIASSSSAAASAACRRCSKLRRAAGRDHARRPAQLPPLPAARLPGRDRRAVAGRDRRSPLRARLQARPERARPARRGRRLRPRAPDRRAGAAAERRGAPALPYDRLIVAGGSRYSYFGHDEWRPFAPDVKSLESALDVRAPDPHRVRGGRGRGRPGAQRAWLTFLVVGGGADRRRDGRPDRRDRARHAPARLPLDRHAQHARILLVETADRVLTGVPAARCREGARASLERLGVDAADSGATVVDIDAESVTVRTPTANASGSRADGGLGRGRARLGARAARSATLAGAEVDRAGRVAVGPDLTLPGHPEVIALGDMVQRARRRRSRGAAAGRRAGRDAAGPLRRPRASAPACAGRPADAVPLPRQGQPRDDRPRPGRRGRQGPAA